MGDPDDKSSSATTDKSHQQSSSLENQSHTESAKPPPATSSGQTSAEKKIEIILKNVGSAPVPKKSKWVVRASSTVSDISKFVIKYLNLDKDQSLFIYVNQSFAPALDQTIENLFDCFESDKKLVLYYATSQAWG